MAVKKIVALYNHVLDDLSDTMYNLASGLKNAYPADKIDDLEMDIEIASSFLEKLYRDVNRFSSENHGGTLLRAVVSILLAVIETLVRLLEKMEEFHSMMSKER
jgi:hypothetical protein